MRKEMALLSLFYLIVMRVDSSMPDPVKEELLRKLSEQPLFKANENKTMALRLKRLAAYESQHERNQDVGSMNDNGLKLPWPYHRWEKSGVDTNMTICCIEKMKRSNKAFIQVSNGGKRVSVKHTFLKRRNRARLRAMERGVTQAIEYARNYMNIQDFPDLYALFVPTDSAVMEHPSFTQCKIRTQKDTEWPPIFAQNRFYGSDNLYVLIPDFSFFISSDKSASWFDELDKEVENKHGYDISSSYSGIDFTEKERTAIYRGTFIEREHEDLRRALLPFNCPSEDLFNISVYQYVSRRDMCRGHQLIVTLPGNGVWSWATKYNMLCNSVTVIVSPKSLGGESWETRASLGMKPGKHYLELSVDKENICEDLKTKSFWVNKHPFESKMMAQRSREVALNYLNRNTVLKNLASLLLGYASLNKSTHLSPAIKEVLLNYFSYDNENTS